jgi:hypothetical protein
MCSYDEKILAKVNEPDRIISLNLENISSSTLDIVLTISIVCNENVHGELYSPASIDDIQSCISSEENSFDKSLSLLILSGSIFHSAFSSILSAAFIKTHAIFL